MTRKKSRLNTGEVESPVQAGAGKRQLLVAGIIGAITLIVDQVTKLWALRALSGGETIPLVGHWLELHLIRNSGAAFSMLSGSTWVIFIFALIIVIGIPFLVWRLRDRVLVVLTGLLWGGALGNLIDRCFQAPGFPNGHVIDFIKYGDWFIGNVADIAIVVAAIGLVLYAFFGGKDSHKRGSSSATDAKADASTEVNAEAGSDASTDTPSASRADSFPGEAK